MRTQTRMKAVVIVIAAALHLGIRTQVVSAVPRCIKCLTSQGCFVDCDLHCAGAGTAYYGSPACTSNGDANYGGGCENDLFSFTKYTCAAYCETTNGCEPGNSNWQWSPDNCGQPGSGAPDLCGCCYSSTPIIVSLRGDKITLSSPEDGVLFDFFGDGHPAKYAWPLDGSDAWLVRDIKHNGLVDINGSNLFGNAAVLSNGEHAANGFQVLEELDINKDGIVDARDPGFDDILIWRDISRNGKVDPGEVVRARDVGILSFETHYGTLRRVDESGNVFRYRARMNVSRPPFDRFFFDVLIESAQ